MSFQDGRPVWAVSSQANSGRGRGRGRGNLLSSVKGGSPFPAETSCIGSNFEKESTLNEHPSTGADSVAVEEDMELIWSGGQQEVELFAEYLKESGDAQGFQEGISKVKQHLLSSSVCLICLDHVSSSCAVWSCRDSCHVVLHLLCLQTWAKQEVDLAAYKASRVLPSFPGAAVQAQQTAQWHCPKCRHGYPSGCIPSSYLCFCGKVEDPTFDPWLVPHSCGDTCAKPLGALQEEEWEGREGGKGGCGHTCTLLCHPGPCPPCPRVVQVPCHCGRGPPAQRRCGANPTSCGKPCAKLLDCKQHRCMAPCHGGPCEPCDRVGLRSCTCGRGRETRPCAEQEWKCGAVCGQPLACRHHTCQEVCHKPGSCGSCPMAGGRSCFCGKLDLPNLQCTQPTTPCGHTCDKLLHCGLHRCVQLCHEGECSAACTQLVERSCRCGGLTKTVPCSQKLQCERKCQRQRSCGRHACKRRCCQGDCAPCGEVCGRKLKCGSHRCTAPCHDGPCLPCPRTVPVLCACGGARVDYPCGAQRHVQLPPWCSAPCSVGPSCRHRPLLLPPPAQPPRNQHGSGQGARSRTVASARPLPPPPPVDETTPLPVGFPSPAVGHLHRCHYGVCPSCPMPVCGEALPCGHPCAVPCHDPPAPAIPSFQEWMETSRRNRAREEQKAASLGTLSLITGPSIPSAVSSLITTTSSSPADGTTMDAHPPCGQPVLQRCVGGHLDRQMPCVESFWPSNRVFICHLACGRQLECGKHTCSRECHPVEPAVGGGVSGEWSELPAEAGGRDCERCQARCDAAPRACGHSCNLPCHSGPCPPCAESVRRPCHGGHQILTRPCIHWPEGGEGCGLECGGSLASCPHSCTLPCHPGTCEGGPQCRKRVTVRCPCKRIKSQWDCNKVQEALVGLEREKYAALTSPASLVAPRVLSCDQECERISASKKVENTSLDPQILSSPPLQQDPNPSTQTHKSRRRNAKPKGEGPSGSKGTAGVDSKLLWTILNLAIVAILGGAIGLWMYRYMEEIDAAAREKWQPDL